jgi:phosphoribosylglycinamide formyltransferase-1
VLLGLPSSGLHTNG